MTLTEKMRTALRIVNTALDDEIERDIDACLHDLVRVGIIADTVYTEDATVIRLCELYCRAAFDFDGKAEMYKKHYEFMRDGISLDGDYKAEVH